MLFPALSDALRGVAARTGATFLDLLRATEGREACTHEDAAQDWQRRVTVDPRALVYGGLDAVGYHLAQESFHPTAAAHAAIGGCLAAFVRSGDGDRGLRARPRHGQPRLPAARRGNSSGHPSAQRGQPSTTRSRGRWLSRSTPSAVTTTMSSMRAPHSPSR